MCRGASVITPNQSEFESVAGVCDSDEELVSRARKMLDDLNLDALLVTRSEKGMLLLEADMEPVFLSTQAREVFDVTGAGDTVIAALAGAVASGQDLPSAAALANLAAGRFPWRAWIRIAHAVWPSRTPLGCAHAGR